MCFLRVLFTLVLLFHFYKIISHESNKISALNMPYFTYLKFTTRRILVNERFGCRIIFWISMYVSISWTFIRATFYWGWCWFGAQVELDLLSSNTPKFAEILDFPIQNLQDFFHFLCAEICWLWMQIMTRTF